MRPREGPERAAESTSGERQRSSEEEKEGAGRLLVSASHCSLETLPVLQDILRELSRGWLFSKEDKAEMGRSD